jgi:hypothetical protein
MVRFLSSTLALRLSAFFVCYVFRVLYGLPALHVLLHALSGVFVYTFLPMVWGLRRSDALS